MRVEATPMRWIRDPLVHFVVLGALVFAAHRGLAGDATEREDPRRIVVEPAFVDALVRERAARTGRPEAELDRDEIEREWAREEALVREAEALGLGAGDLVIRRRLVQKLELLVRAGVEPDEPTEAELEAFRAAHADTLREPPRTSFVHRFFSRDRRGERARIAALASLEAGEAGEAGDAFPLGARFEGRSDAAIAELFGSPWVAVLREAPIGAWSGPIESRFGVHLVRVEARTDGRALALDEVRDVVRRRLLEEREQARVQAALEAIVESYRIERAP
ncbi:MAG: hypothetical protein OHK0013_08880 [Sandaracinaceae bacterium]